MADKLFPTLFVPKPGEGGFPGADDRWNAQFVDVFNSFTETGNRLAAKYEDDRDPGEGLGYMIVNSLIHMIFLLIVWTDTPDAKLQEVINALRKSVAVTRKEHEGHI